MDILWFLFLLRIDAKGQFYIPSQEPILEKVHFARLQAIKLQLSCYPYVLVVTIIMEKRNSNFSLFGSRKR